MTDQSINLEATNHRLLFFHTAHPKPQAVYEIHQVEYRQPHCQHTAKITGYADYQGADPAVQHIEENRPKSPQARLLSRHTIPL